MDFWWDMSNDLFPLEDFGLFLWAELGWGLYDFWLVILRSSSTSYCFSLKTLELSTDAFPQSCLFHLLLWDLEGFQKWVFISFCKGNDYVSGKFVRDCLTP